jgi:hypothetical protein
VGLTASVRDSTFLDVNDATVIARITSPTGVVQELPLEWTVEEDGQYGAPFRPLELGDYEIEVSAARQGASLGSDISYLHSAPSDREFFGAARRTQLLQRIADDTGGQFYTRESVSSLPEDITISGAGVTLVDELDLWDMPALFLLMLLLMGAEWGYRRIRGLV